MKALRRVAVYLGLVEEPIEEWQARECRHGRHEWGLWMHDTSPVPLFKLTNGDERAQVGWSFVAIAGPDYRKCQWCPAMERRG